VRRLVHPAVLCLLLAYASAASAQTNLQLWGNVTLDWVKTLSAKMGETLSFPIMRV
jgi:hypothetical protein